MRILRWFVKVYGFWKKLTKQDIVSYNTLVCSDCLEILQGHIDIDLIEFWNCPKCKDIRYVSYPDEVKPIGLVVIN